MSIHYQDQSIIDYILSHNITQEIKDGTIQLNTKFKDGFMPAQILFFASAQYLKSLGVEFFNGTDVASLRDHKGNTMLHQVMNEGGPSHGDKVEKLQFLKSLVSKDSSDSKECKDLKEVEAQSSQVVKDALAPAIAKACAGNLELDFMNQKNNKGHTALEKSSFKCRVEEIECNTEQKITDHFSAVRMLIDAGSDQRGAFGKFLSGHYNNYGDHKPSALDGFWNSEFVQTLKSLTPQQEIVDFCCKKLETSYNQHKSFGDNTHLNHDVCAEILTSAGLCLEANTEL